MATAEEIAAFRLLIDESDDNAPYTDAVLSERLDSVLSPESLASIIWTEKAAAASALVNVSESGSSRSLGDLQEKMLAMAKHFRDNDPNAPGTGTNTRGVRMKRLTR